MIRGAFRQASAAIFLLVLNGLAPRASAQDFTWKSSPADGVWNNSANWDPAGFPNEASEAAHFGSSSVTAVSFSESTAFGSLDFASGASAYTITVGTDYAVEIIDGNMTNFSANIQNFVVNGGFACLDGGDVVGDFSFTSTGGIDALMSFCNGSAGSASILATNSARVFFQDGATASSANVTTEDEGFVAFLDDSTAGTATLTANGSSGFNFMDEATAGSAQVILTDAFSIASFAGTSKAGQANFTGGGQVQFGENSSAESATITANVMFTGSSSAGSATITVQSGGFAMFADTSAGGTASLTVDGFMDISNSGGVGIGSLAGGGAIGLGSKKLTIGSNDANTTFSGSIDDGNQGGSVDKTGDGTLTLSGTSTYTGPTVIHGGMLAVNGDISNSSLTTVHAGATLSGHGTVGDSTIGGTLSPGSSPGVLTVEGSLMLQGTGTIHMELGGLVRGTQYDGLNITGTVSLDGTLNVVLINGFSPAQGDSFDLFDWITPPSSIFGSVNLPTLGGALSWDTSALYSSGVITAVPEPTTLTALLAGSLFLAIKFRKKLYIN